MIKIIDPSPRSQVVDTIKSIATRVAKESSEDVEPKEIFQWACTADNDLSRHEGFSPFALLLGRTPAAGQGL